MTGKSISYPGLESRVEETDVSNHIMEMLKARSAFVEHEFKTKIKEAEKKKVPSYMDELYETGDKVLFQDKDDKVWKYGVIKDSRSNEIKIESDGVEKRVHPDRVQKFHDEIVEQPQVEKKNVNTNNVANEQDKCKT